MTSDAVPAETCVTGSKDGVDVLCNDHGACRSDNTCVCHPRWDGEHCTECTGFASLPTSLQPCCTDLSAGGMNDGALAGAIIGWLFGLPLVTAGLAIWWSNKDGYWKEVLRAAFCRSSLLLVIRVLPAHRTVRIRLRRAPYRSCCAIAGAR